MSWVAPVLVLLGCAHAPIDGAADIQGGRPGDHHFVRTSHYSHEVKTAEGVVQQVVEYGWDYDKAVVVERTFNEQGTLLGTRDVPGQILRATEEEQSWAFDLVKRHPDLRSSVTAPNVHLYGGFILMEQDDPYCHLRSRCVYVFASLGDGSRKVAQAIVDLQTNRVVYPAYEPETTQPLK